MYELVRAAIMARDSTKVAEGMSVASAVNSMVAGLVLASTTMSAQSRGKHLVMQEFAFLELRRHGDKLFRPIITKRPDGREVFVNAFEHHFIVDETDTILDIINAMPSLSPMSIYWQDTVAPNVTMIASDLGSANNTSLPRLATNPQFMSFKNGQYNMVSVSYVLFVCVCS